MTTTGRHQPVRVRSCAARSRSTSARSSSTSPMAPPMLPYQASIRADRRRNAAQVASTPATIIHSAVTTTSSVTEKSV